MDGRLWLFTIYMAKHSVYVLGKCNFLKCPNGGGIDFHAKKQTKRIVQT